MASGKQSKAVKFSGKQSKISRSRVRGKGDKVMKRKVKIRYNFYSFIVFFNKINYFNKPIVSFFY